jgi:hypothetical protein
MSNKIKLKPIKLNLDTELVVFGLYSENYYTNQTLYKLTMLPKEQYDLFEMDDAFKSYVEQPNGNIGFYKETLTTNKLFKNKFLLRHILDNQLDFTYTSDLWFEQLFDDDNAKYEFNLYELIEDYIEQIYVLLEVF